MKIVNKKPHLTKNEISTYHEKREKGLINNLEYYRFNMNISFDSFVKLQHMLAYPQMILLESIKNNIEFLKIKYCN